MPRLVKSLCAAACKPTLIKKVDTIFIPKADVKISCLTKRKLKNTHTHKKQHTQNSLC